VTDHTVREILQWEGWKLTPQAWLPDGTAIGYKLSGNSEDRPIPATVQFADEADTVTLTWWEEACLYYRSVK
jgi:hypothetical protein